MRLFAAGLKDWRLRAVVHEVMNATREAWLEKDVSNITHRVELYREKLRAIRAARLQVEERDRTRDPV